MRKYFFIIRFAFGFIFGFGAICYANSDKSPADNSKKCDEFVNQNIEMIQSVIAIVKNGNRKLILLRTKTDRSFPGQWCLPGGRVDSDESVETAVLRELREETGLTGKIIRKLEVAESKLLSRSRIYQIHVFEVQVDDFSGLKISSEHTEFRWITADEAKHLVTMPLTSELISKY